MKEKGYLYLQLFLTLILSEGTCAVHGKKVDRKKGAFGFGDEAV